MSKDNMFLKGAKELTQSLTSITLPYKTLSASTAFIATVGVCMLNNIDISTFSATAAPLEFALSVSMISMSMLGSSMLGVYTAGKTLCKTLQSKGFKKKAGVLLSGLAITAAQFGIGGLAYKTTRPQINKINAIQESYLEETKNDCLSRNVDNNNPEIPSKCALKDAFEKRYKGGEITKIVINDVTQKIERVEGSIPNSAVK